MVIEQKTKDIVYADVSFIIFNESSARYVSRIENRKHQTVYGTCVLAKNALMYPSLKSAFEDLECIRETSRDDFKIRTIHIRVQEL